MLLVSGRANEGDGDTSVFCESAGPAESRAKGVPSSRQKLSVSSSKVRLQVEQRFTVALSLNHIERYRLQSYFTPCIMAAIPQIKMTAAMPRK